MHKISIRRKQGAIMSLKICSKKVSEFVYIVLCEFVQMCLRYLSKNISSLNIYDPPICLSDFIQILSRQGAAKCFSVEKVDNGNFIKRNLILPVWCLLCIVQGDCEIFSGFVKTFLVHQTICIYQSIIQVVKCKCQIFVNGFSYALELVSKALESFREP